MTLWGGNGKPPHLGKEQVMTPKPETPGAPVAGTNSHATQQAVSVERLLVAGLTELSKALDRLDRIIDEQSVG